MSNNLRLKFEDRVYQKLKVKMEEVSSLPVHPFGKFTPYYRGAAPLFKVAPWRLGLVLAIFATLFLLFVFGPSFVRLATLLSRGF